MTTICGMPETRVNPVALGSLLVFQNAGAVLLMRWVRAMPGESDFNTQTAVVMQEVLKGLTCVIILLGTEGTLASAWAKPVEALKTGQDADSVLLWCGPPAMAADTATVKEALAS